MSWTAKDKELLKGACSDGARWALGLSGPKAVLSATDQPSWTFWLCGAYIRLKRKCPITPEVLAECAKAAPLYALRDA